jgi:uncharacterized protein YbbC (DUF1343 family)
MTKLTSFVLMIFLMSCNANSTHSELPQSKDSVSVNPNLDNSPQDIRMLPSVGAAQMNEYLPLLAGKRVGIVGNQSSMIGSTHLVDSLLDLDVNIVRIFSPEHGFRGDADAGEKVLNGRDVKTNLPIISLYGKNKKPYPEQLKDIDVLLFDIQDVGVRFYTYISTLHYVMEAAAENNVSVIVLDRPNPNGHYVDGPLLKEGFQSFIGMHKVPVVHGMTIGEYAQMINGEKWLEQDVSCELQVIKCKNWDHTCSYTLPIAPSPNLPNMTAIYLYPSLCFFEGTKISIGRGTDFPFQIFGHPDLKNDSMYQYSFIPAPNFGAKSPKLNGETCYGKDLHKVEKAQDHFLDLTYLIDVYRALDQPEDFFLKNDFINLLAGTDQLKMQIIAGTDMETIRNSWKKDLADFNVIREKYLLYKDF